MQEKSNQGRSITTKKILQWRATGDYFGRITIRTFYLLITVYLISGISCRSFERKFPQEDSLVTKRDTIAAVDPPFTDQHILLKCLKYCGEGKPTDKKGTEENPFHIIKTVRNDTLLVTFNFISDGEQNFVKDIHITQDTLFLDYKTNSNTIAEIYVEYFYQFVIPKCTWKVIYLKKLKV